MGKVFKMDQVKFVEDSLQKFLRLSSTYFTWSILEYFDPSMNQFNASASRYSIVQILSFFILIDFGWLWKTFISSVWVM